MYHKDNPNASRPECFRDPANATEDCGGLEGFLYGKKGWWEVLLLYVLEYLVNGLYAAGSEKGLLEFLKYFYFYNFTGIAYTRMVHTWKTKRVELAIARACHPLTL